MAMGYNAASVLCLRNNIELSIYFESSHIFIENRSNLLMLYQVKKVFAPLNEILTPLTFFEIQSQHLLIPPQLFSGKTVRNFHNFFKIFVVSP